MLTVRVREYSDCTDTGMYLVEIEGRLMGRKICEWFYTLGDRYSAEKAARRYSGLIGTVRLCLRIRKEANIRKAGGIVPRVRFIW